MLPEAILWGNELGGIDFMQFLFKVLFFFKKLINKFYFWLCWVFVAARGLSLVAVSGGYSRCSVQASLCGGFSGCRVWALGHLGFGSCDTFLSSWGFQALEHRLKSSDLWAQLLCGMLDLP